MHRRSLLLSLGLAPGGLPLAAPPAQAQRPAFPDRPVSLVTGYAPGGSTDIAARLLAERLAWHLAPGARLQVDNRPGAAGAVASEWLRRQPADGHTVMIAETGSHAIAPNAMAGWNRYDPVADFTHLGIIGAPPLVLVVNNGFQRVFGARTATEVVARLRESAPDSIAYATSGVGGVLHLASEVLALDLGTRFVHVPYRSGAQMLQSIHNGEVQFGIAALASATAMLRQGLVQGVAVTGRERFAAFPELPTMAEVGVPGFEFEAWYILIGPPNLPPPVAEALNAALVLTLAEAPVRDRLRQAGHDTWRGPNRLADALSFIEREVERYRLVVARTGIRLDP